MGSPSVPLLVTIVYFHGLSTTNMSCFHADQKIIAVDDRDDNQISQIHLVRETGLRCGFDEHWSLL